MQGTCGRHRVRNVGRGAAVPRRVGENLVRTGAHVILAGSYCQAVAVRSIRVKYYYVRRAEARRTFDKQQLL